MIELFVVASFAALFFITLVYCLAMAIVGQALGATVEDIVVGIGPKLFRVSFFGFQATFRAFPVSGYAKFFNDSGDAEPFSIVKAHEAQAPVAFESLSPITRIAILAVGPLSSIALGLTALAIPVFAGSGQIAVVLPQESEIRPCACGGLAVNTSSTTWRGQMQFFAATAIEYIVGIFTFQRMDHWGGVIGFIVTCAATAQVSIMGWLTCIGVLGLLNGIVNLLPLPILNGGRILLISYSVFTGRETAPGVFNGICLVALMIWMVVLIRIVWLDLAWLWGLVRESWTA